MINVSDNLKNAVINEEMPKEMSVTITNTSNLKVLNWYKEEIIPTGYWYPLDIPPNSYWQYYTIFKFREDGAINYDYLDQSTRLGFRCDIKIDEIDPNSAQYVQFRLGFLTDDDTTIYMGMDNAQLSHYENYTSYSRSTSSENIKSINYLRIYNSDSTKNLKCKIHFKNARVYMYVGDDLQGVDDYCDIFATEENVNKYVAIGTFDNSNIVEESFSYTESICSEEKLKLGLCESSELSLSLFNTRNIPIGADIDISMAFPNATDKFEWKNFQIAEVKKTQRGSYSIREIVAYDRLSALNENMYAWYNKYMWGMNLQSSAPAVPHKFDYARQIYSTLRRALLENRIETPLLATNLYESISYDPTENKTQDRYFNYTTESYVTYKRIIFCKKTITHKVGCDVGYVETTTQIASGYWNLIDEFYRGISANANVYIDFNLDNGEVVRILDDSVDGLFAIPENCTTFDVYVPYAFGDNNFNVYQNGIFVTNVLVIQDKHTKYDVYKIVNGYKQLPYYKYSENGKPTVNDIIKVKSDLTLRDIVTSLCEMCGCFFRLDRNGVPKFLYPQEHGLYPSNTLYPADDLFPKKSSEMTMPTSYYISAQYEDEQIAKFGGVQVIVNTTNNTGGVCRWEYWAGEEVDSSYVIDDNIFLCSDELVYNADVDDIPNILENIYQCLDNAQYTPYEAETIGTPFLESGDRFTLLTKNDGFESFIFERKLRGIQALKDHFEARGIAKTPRVKNFEWQQ